MFQPFWTVWNPPMILVGNPEESPRSTRSLGKASIWREFGEKIRYKSWSRRWVQHLQWIYILYKSYYVNLHFLQHPGYNQHLIYDGFRGWWTKTPREGVAKGREISVPETVQAEAPSPSCWTWMSGNDSVRRSRWLRGNMHLRKLLSQLHLLFYQPQRPVRRDLPTRARRHPTAPAVWNLLMMFGGWLKQCPMSMSERKHPKSVRHAIGFMRIQLGEGFLK